MINVDYLLSVFRIYTLDMFVINSGKQISTAFFSHYFAYV